MIDDLRALARALDGKVIGRVVRAPAPGCSRNSVALAVGLSDRAPDGWWAIDHSGRMTPREAADYVRKRLGMPLLERKTKGLNDVSAPYSQTSADNDVDRIAAALRFWEHGKDPRGTLVYRYLASRGLPLPDRLVDGDVIRWHAGACAMLALFRNLHTGQPQAISRTFLTADGIKVERKFLGPVADAAMMLTAFDDITAGLTIAEGFETALATEMLGFKPTWALGSAGAISRFPVLGGIETLTISRETDDGGVNFKAAETCAERWHGAGREVFFITPRIRGDTADLVRGAA